MWGAIGGFLSEPIKTWLETRKIKKEGQVKVLVAKAEAQAAVYQKVTEGQVEWEKVMAQATEKSWKDEFALVVVLTPFIFSFIPFLQPYAQGAIDFVTKAPEWYQWVFGMVISASFGVKFTKDIYSLFRR